MLIDGSEEKKTEMCINSDFAQLSDSPKYRVEVRNSKLKNKQKASKLINYLFDIDDIVCPKVKKRNVDEDQEDDNIEDLRIDSPKLVSLRSNKTLVAN